MKDFLNKLFLIFICLSIFSCKKDEKFIETIVNNEMLINVDGTDYRSINENVGGNENCENLFINASYYDKNKIDFTIKFQISKDGELIRVWYQEYILPLTSGQGILIYLTPNFNPLSTFDISNFYYNFNTGEVKFNFNGTLFFESNNSIKKSVSGKVKIKSFKTIECSIAKKGLTYKDVNFKLFSFSTNMTKYGDQTQLHRFFSNNGFEVSFLFENDLWNYSIGTVIFDENQLLNRADFKKAIGPIIADQLQLFDDKIWKKYETSGSIIIQEKYIEKYQKVIKGKLNLIAKENGEVKFKLIGIEFRTGSFAN